MKHLFDYQLEVDQGKVIAAANLKSDVLRESFPTSKRSLIITKKERRR